MSASVISSSDLRELIRDYVDATKDLGSVEDREDYRRVAAIALRLADSVASGDAEQMSKDRFAFNHQVTDCYAIQPKEFSPLAKAIESIDV